ncbi:hypothetical protein CFHF_20035 [Caulobacter flavus]|uniref:Uncharacterized protein n=1 Tax=Caulobacter flavus TaxID=1679497 RepID=A0A2N5CP86_9CAUL|nr:hypothetical protein [Caulobacter flavus]AYV48546.1 hypothetical protein C1707_21030 [Caulobacter flavus]PLR08738.1 hypothetical protein CFHF_20035 [Caulobacter flavus]
MPDRSPPDGAFFAPEHDEALWSLAPWITDYRVAPSDGYDATFVEVWLRPPRACEIAEFGRTPRPVPDRAHDIEFHNVGDAPPIGFWHFHPTVEAFEIEYDRDDGSAWWARVWLKTAP